MMKLPLVDEEIRTLVFREYPLSKLQGVLTVEAVPTWPCNGGNTNLCLEMYIISDGTRYRLTEVKED